MTSPRSDVEREGTPLVEQAARLCRAGDRPGLSALAEAWLEWLARRTRAEAPSTLRDVVVDDRGELSWIGLQPRRATPATTRGAIRRAGPSAVPPRRHLRGAGRPPGAAGARGRPEPVADRPRSPPRPRLGRPARPDPLARVQAVDRIGRPRGPSADRSLLSPHEFPLDDLPALGEVVRLPRRRRSPMELLADLRALVREAADLSAVERVVGQAPRVRADPARAGGPGDVLDAPRRCAC